MSTQANRNRFAIAPPAPESSSGGDETMIRPAGSRQDRTGSSGEFSLMSHAEQPSERQTLPDLGQAPVPVIETDDLREERNDDTIPAPTWLGDE